MNILWLENWRRALKPSKWFTTNFVKTMSGHTSIYLYGPQLEKYFPELVPIPYTKELPFKEIISTLEIDIIVMHTKPFLIKHNESSCWLADDFAKVHIPKVCLEIDYQYESDDKWYQKMGINLILQRALSLTLRQQIVPMKWLPWSVNENIFKPNPHKTRKNRICFAGSLRPFSTYYIRSNACKVLLKNNLIDVFSNRQKVNETYFSCLQEYVSHLSGSSKFDFPSSKNFEIMSSGSVLLTDKFSGIEELFPDGSYCLYNKDCSNVVDMAKKIIKDIDFREEIVRKGRQCILQRHTHDIRASDLISILEGLV